MKVLVTGTTGQLGSALQRCVPDEIEIICMGRAELDLSDPDACRQAVQQHQPDWVLNAGAYTAVDQAESEPEIAMAVNAGAPRAFTDALNQHGGKLLQISTDFVFNGEQSTPYKPDQEKNPIGVYGKSKAKGEEAILSGFGTSNRGMILRTSWVIGPVGKNFALTMLKLHANKDEIGVVADQVGCPTCTHTLASACWQIITINEKKRLPTIMHWSEAGAASWYDVAVAVGELGQELGLLNRYARVKPITTNDYPTPAQRPSYSLLDCYETRKTLDIEGVHWRQSLRTCLNEIKQQTKQPLRS